MKVAILDADPRICGPMSWMRHLESGFNQLGHETTIISSTKSGRPRSSWGTEKWGNHWSVYTPGLTVKDDDLAEALDSFDLIVLPEPKVPAADKEALKLKDDDGKRQNMMLPVYVDALQRTKTPFIFALHGNDYDSKSAPFMFNLMCQDNWTNTVISHSARSTGSNPVFQHPDVRVVESPLPYLPARDVEAPRQYTLTVGTTGRFIFNKGPHLVALAATQMHNHDNVTVELWGSAAAGLGASHTYTTYEEMLQFAEKYKRYGDQEEKRGQPGWTEHGNIIRPYLWDVRTKAGPLVRYLGNYSDAITIAERLTVHVNLTGVKFSGGLVEYSTLEAMDGGALCITTPQVSKPDVFSTRQFVLENPAGSAKSAIKQQYGVTEMLAEDILSVLNYANDQPKKRDEIVKYNRQALREYNNPAKIAQTFIEGAFN